ncbi:MAG: LapA family protein [Synechococcaceae cyanobacterium SM2_3_2]|nr:LapA family protein [Synechococcaceae cyanobacterium SM2_3_2]
MKQVDFLILFVVLLGISLFAMQNANPVAVTLAPNLSFELPLAIELLVAAGTGAAFFWIYGLWMKMQFVVESRNQTRELREKEAFIEDMKKTVTEMESKLKQLPPSKRAEAQDGEVEVDAKQVAETTGS